MQCLIKVSLLGSATKPYPKVTRNPTPMYLQDKSENIEYKSKPKAESQAKYLCDNYLPRKSTDCKCSLFTLI